VRDSANQVLPSASPSPQNFFFFFLGPQGVSGWFFGHVHYFGPGKLVTGPFPPLLSDPFPCFLPQDSRPLPISFPPPLSRLRHFFDGLNAARLLTLPMGRGPCPSARARIRETVFSPQAPPPPFLRNCGPRSISAHILATFSRQPHRLSFSYFLFFFFFSLDALDEFFFFRG